MIAGIVLAAGRSARMGEPKALLRLEGRTFLDHAVAVLRAGGCDAVWVVAARNGGTALREEVAQAGAALVTNPLPDAEQIDSLRIGLDALPAGAVAALVLPVDVPRAEPAVVAALIAAFRRTGAPIAVPVADGRHGHPVLFARTVWGELHAPELPEGARSVVHAHAADRVEVPVAALPADVDTPADYRRLLGEP